MVVVKEKPQLLPRIHPMRLVINYALLRWGHFWGPHKHLDISMQVFHRKTVPGNAYISLDNRESEMTITGNLRFRASLRTPEKHCLSPLAFNGTVALSRIFWTLGAVTTRVVAGTAIVQWNVKQSPGELGMPLVRGTWGVGATKVRTDFSTDVWYIWNPVILYDASCAQ